MTVEKICLYQFIRRKNIYKEGCGDCEVCESSELNKLCSNYYEISVQFIEIKE